MVLHAWLKTFIVAIFSIVVYLLYLRLYFPLLFLLMYNNLDIWQFVCHLNLVWKWFHLGLCNMRNSKKFWNPRHRFESNYLNALS